MTRTVVFLMTLVFVFPSDGSTQTASLGDRIRIEQVDGTILTGTLATVSAEAIQLSVDSSRVEGGIAIPRSQIATLERQQGTRNKSTLVGIVGLLAGGAIAWATLGDKETRSCDGGFGVDVGCRVAADIEVVENAAGDVVRVLLGMVAGGVVGALVGSALRTENWVMVPSIEMAPPDRAPVHWNLPSAYDSPAAGGLGEGAGDWRFYAPPTPLQLVQGHRTAKHRCGAPVRLHLMVPYVPRAPRRSVQGSHYDRERARRAHGSPSRWRYRSRRVVDGSVSPTFWITLPDGSSTL